MSINLVKIGQHRVLAIADSRGCYKYGPPRDDLLKLFQLGSRTVAGIGGLTEIRPGDDIAERVEKLSAVDALADSPREFMTALASDLHEPLRDRFAKNPHLFKWLLADTSIVLTAFCLTRERSGEITLLELQFALENRDGAPACGEPQIITHAERLVPARQMMYCAPTDFPMKHLFRQLDADSPDDCVLADVDRLFETAKRENAVCRAEIGGPLDVAVIDAEGFRWLRRKPAWTPEIPAAGLMEKSSRLFWKYTRTLAEKESAWQATSSR